MSRIENQSLRRSKRIQQRKRSEEKQKNNKKRKLEENVEYFNQAVQLSDGRVGIARIKQVTVRGVPVEASATTSVEPEKNHNVLPNRSNQKATQGSTVSLNKEKKQSQKPRRKSISKNKPAASSSKTKTPLLKLSDKVTEVPHMVITQPCSTFNLSGELNTVRLLENNSNNQHCHTHHVIMPNSETLLNQLSDTNNITNATEGHTSTLRHQFVTGQHCDAGHSQHEGSVNQCCENNVHTIRNCLVNTKQNQTMSQVSNINGNCSPARVPHNATCTPAVLQTNQFQNTVSRQLFPPKQMACHPQPSSSMPNPSIHSKGSACFVHGNHMGEPSCSNPTTFHSQTKSNPVQQLLQCYKCQKVHQVNQHLPNRGPADLTNLPLTQHFQQANNVHHIVHHINPHIYNSLAGLAEHHCFQNQQSGNNIFSSGQRQGISAQDTATSQVFNYNKHASQSTQQQLSNSRGQPQEHTIFLPFYGNIPIEIEIK